MNTTQKQSFHQLLAKLKQVKQASYSLARSSHETRNAILRQLSEQIRQEGEQILAANRSDLEGAQKLVDSGELSESMLQRLALNTSKLADLSRYPETIAALADPKGQLQYSMELDSGLVLRRISCPIGVVAVIFESRPEVVIQISALAIKSGNAVLLKGGQEARQSNSALFGIVQRVLQGYALEQSIYHLQSREEVSAILQATEQIDLIIPRGSSDLVRSIQQQTAIPVLGHAEGVCHVYLDALADPQKALDIVLDAKLEYPAVCNAAETLLVHCDLEPSVLVNICSALHQQGCLIHCDTRVAGILEVAAIPHKSATEQDWRSEYGEGILAIKIVESLTDACDHINQYGSGHTDAIITENQESADYFMAQVDSASVMVNASTRFADGYVYGLGAEVGVSTGKFHARGPVGLEGLMTYKYLLQGNGHCKGAYTRGESRFTHARLAEKEA